MKESDNIPAVILGLLKCEVKTPGYMTDVDELIPANFICTLTLEAFDDPVVSNDGHTYSRSVIEHWFSLQQTSPMTNERSDNTQVLPNHTLRKAIEEWRGKQPLPIDT